MGDTRNSTPRNFTRRTLLGGLAAAGAVRVVDPVGALAAALEPARTVSSRWLGTISGRSGEIRAPRRFSLVGIQWAEPGSPGIELRARRADGGWGPWAPASSAGHGPDGPSTVPGRFGEPVWVGPSDYVQVRAHQRVEGVRLHFVSPPRAPGAEAAAGPPIANPVLNAGPGQPPIIARRAWAQGQAPPGAFAGYGTVKLGFVHHTVNPNGYGAAEVPSLLLGIFQYHRYVRGFFDIAYNFLIDAYGRIWEGRAGGIDMAVIGAHAGAYNAQSTGVAMLGDFMSVVPTQAAIGALERLLAWKLSLHGVPTHGRVTVIVDPADYFYTPFPPGAHVSLPRVAGHRDGDSTDCPGNALYRRLPSIRPRIDALAGTPARLTVNPPSELVTAGVPVTVSGRLRIRNGPPLPGAPIEIQQLGSPGVATTEATIATATTAQDGTWSAVVTLQTNQSLRALHRPGPAAVADWVPFIVVPAITLTVQSTSPLLVSGTIVPSKPHVTVELYRGGPTSGNRVRRRRVRVKHGRFSVKLSPPGPGSYVLVAVSDADALNEAGASEQVPVTIS